MPSANQRPEKEHPPRPLLFTVVALAVSASVMLPAAASGASAEMYTLVGAETRASTVVGSFVGGAFRAPSDGMLWKAVVRHTPLTRDPARAAQITGGTLTLKVELGGRFSSVTGAFTGGMVVYLKERSSVSACGRQVFQVVGTLAEVKREMLSGNGTLQVYLTHHRRMIWGRCITYAATVTGSLSLSF
jgi:hypothetical protein